MNIDFTKIEEKKIENFRGGEGTALVRMFMDGDKKIMMLRLEKGSSVGYHRHDTNQEIVYIVKGTATINFENEISKATQGMSHYCPLGSSHSIKNEEDETLELFCTIL